MTEVSENAVEGNGGERVGEGERRREMERSNRESLGDGDQSRVAPKATSEESRVRRRRDLCQGLSQLRTSPNYQGLCLSSPFRVSLCFHHLISDLHV